MSAIANEPENMRDRKTTARCDSVGSVLADCMVVDYTHRTRPSGSVFATEKLMNPADSTLDTKSLAVHVVVTMSDAQADGRVLRLDELAADLGVRKADVRHVITRLHAEGLVDALRLRLTMSGLALATSLGASALPALRRHEERIVRVA